MRIFKQTYLFKAFPEYAYLEVQALRERCFGFDVCFAVRGIEPGTAGWESSTQPLCTAVPTTKQAYLNHYYRMSQISLKVPLGGPLNRLAGLELGLPSSPWVGPTYVPHVPCFPSSKKKLKQILDLGKISPKNDSLEVSAESHRFVSANPTEDVSCHVEES